MKRTVGILTVITGMEYGINFLRSILIAALFGVSVYTEAFFLVYPLIMTVVLIAASAVKTTVIPVFLQIRERTGEDSAWRFAGDLFVLIFLGSLCACAVAVLCAPWVIERLIGTYPPHVQQSAVKYLRGLSTIVLFLGAGSLLSGLLQARRDFILPAVSTLTGSAVLILLIVFFHRRAGLDVLMYAFIAQAGVSFLIQFARMRSLGRFRLSWPVRCDDRLRRVFRLMIPLVVTLAVTQCARMVEAYLASREFIGSISTINYARMLSEIPSRVFYAVLVTVFFPVFSEQMAQLRLAEARVAVVRLFRIILLCGIPATVLCYVCALPIVELVFQRGAFSAADTLRTAQVFSFFSFSIIAVLLASLLVHVYCALLDTRTLALITTAAMGMNILFDFMLVRVFSYSGLAIGYTLAVTLNCVVLSAVLLRKVRELDFRPALGVLPKLLVASGVMWGVSYLVFRHCRIHFVFASAAGIISYAVALRLVGVEEAEVLFSRIGSYVRYLRDR
ncbi:MAG: polysaccharide biosynthesis C-terminal domain-containing protein [Candidatus Omnitrophica bacterium]|nr:polysaccharide biosynthesis C-terminal domain-containing protein [Candidatus Omnitrophota bacterium]